MTFTVTRSFLYLILGLMLGLVGALASAETLAPTLTAKTPLKITKTKASSPDMLTFHQWKTNRLFEAKAVLAQLNQEIKTAEHRHVEKTKIDHLKHRYQQASHNLDVANDLNAHDYFVAYVNENFPNNPKALTFMVKHMSPAETADILIQYQHSLSQAQVSSNGSANAPTSLRGSSRGSNATAGLSSGRASLENSPTLADFGGRLQLVHRAIDDDPIRETSSGRASPRTL